MSENHSFICDTIRNYTLLLNICNIRTIHSIGRQDKQCRSLNLKYCCYPITLYIARQLLLTGFQQRTRHFTHNKSTWKTHESSSANISFSHRNVYDLHDWLLIAGIPHASTSAHWHKTVTEPASSRFARCNVNATCIALTDSSAGLVTCDIIDSDHKY